MADDRLTGSQKAAVLLYSLGEELASHIVKQLDEGEIRKLSGSMSKMFSISPKMMETILSEFHHLASSDLPVFVGHSGGVQFMRKVLSRAIEGGRAQEILKEVEGEQKGNLFEKIKQLDAKTVSSLIKHEHPQTIAIILVHLDSNQTAAILDDFPPPLQAEVIPRMAELENIPSGIVEEIDLALQDEIPALKGTPTQQQGGVPFVAEVLNQMKGSVEDTILKGIEEQNQALAEEIRRRMFVFEDLLKVDDRSIMAILKEINNETLMSAMKTASEELKEKIFKNMSERAAQMIKEDLEVMGPVRLKDVETAQQSILKIGKKLESEGKIVLTVGKEEAFV
jgi:flagellar motor switch protein FliG